MLVELMSRMTSHAFLTLALSLTILGPVQVYHSSPGCCGFMDISHLRADEVDCTCRWYCKLPVCLTIDCELRLTRLPAGSILGDVRLKIRSPFQA